MNKRLVEMRKLDKELSGVSWELGIHVECECFSLSRDNLVVYVFLFKKDDKEFAYPVVADCWSLPNAIYEACGVAEEYFKECEEREQD